MDSLLKSVVNMKKTTLIKSVFASSIALSATFASPSFASPIVMPDAPQIAAKGYVLMDYHSGKVLAEQEMNTKHLLETRF